MAARIEAALVARKRGELLALRRCFGQGAVSVGGKYVGALVSDLPGCNGWKIAQRGG